METEPIVVTAPEKPKRRQPGVIHRTGYYRKTLDEDELVVFEAVYAELYATLEDLDPVLDDALVVEFVKNVIMLQRKLPPPAPTTGNRPAYDYQMARSKLVLSFADALGLSRKHRREQESGKNIEDVLNRFFKAEGRAASAKRTVTKRSVDGEGNVLP